MHGPSPSAPSHANVPSTPVIQVGRDDLELEAPDRPAKQARTRDVMALEERHEGLAHARMIVLYLRKAYRKTFVFSVLLHKKTKQRTNKASTLYILDSDVQSCCALCCSCFTPYVS